MVERQWIGECYLKYANGRNNECYCARSHFFSVLSFFRAKNRV